MKQILQVKRRSHCIDEVVGNILSGWRYDISGLSPAMRTDYEQHLKDCATCRRRQHVSRAIDVLLIGVSTLSMVAFLLAAIVIRRVETAAHIARFQVHIYQSHAVVISLQAVAITGLVLSVLLWVFVAIATPLPRFLGGLVQERLPEEIRERFSKAD